MRGLRASALVMLVSAVVAVAVHAAPPYDGSASLQCAIQTVMSCGEPMTCVRGTAATVGLPPALTFDVPKRVISGPATGRTVRIDTVGRDSGRLALHGAEVGSLGVQWSVLIAEDSGRMAASVVNQEGGFLMFGTCSS